MEQDSFKDLKDTLRRELDSLHRTGEELRLQASLARADLRAEWDQVEKRLRIAQEELGKLSSHTQAAGRELEQRVRTLIDEVKAAYERLRGVE
jgi:predicted  nucleic acid-binding Zn-ribbon protein